MRAFIARLLRRTAPLPIAQPTGCRCGWPDSTEHAFVVTSPPGYGTIHDPCVGGNTPVQGFSCTHEQAQAWRP